jgi:16S rRNA processing protein RimM
VTLLPRKRETDITRRLIPLGVFGAPQGLKGELRVKSYAHEPEAVGSYGALTDALGSRTFVFENLRPLKEDMLVVRVAGVTTREAAEALNGVEFFVPRDSLPPPGEDEFYHADLVGLEAATREGETLGRVIALRNFGAGDILEIAPERGGDTLMLPFTKHVAIDIDFAAGRIVIAPPREIEGESAPGAA